MKNPRRRRGLKISGARTRTNAAGVEQRACRAGPEGGSRLRRIIERSSMESPYARNEKPPPKARVKNKWCPDSESNQGHGDFQSPALPTELSGQRGALNLIHCAPSTKFLHFVTECTIYHHFLPIARALRQKRPSRERRAALPAPAPAAYSPRQTSLSRRCAARSPAAEFHRRR